MANFQNGKKKKRFLKGTLLLVFLEIVVIPLIVFVFFSIMEYKMYANEVILNSIKTPEIIYNTVFSNENCRKLFIILQGIPIIAITYLIFPNRVNLKDTTETIKVANFEIPKPVGKGQMGTSRFATEEEKEEMFTTWIEDTPLKKGGMIMGSKIVDGKRKFYFDSEDVNTLIIGTTRSGKSRREYLPSIYLLANSGENLYVNDPKGELYIYTKEYLEEKGYKVLNIDFRNPKKSLKYNYLQYIVEDAENNRIDEAVEKTWDIVSLFVGEAKGEKLWNNGEASVLASAILYICLEAPEKKYKNLTNVYYFIANMCKSDDEGNMPISKIYQQLEVTHPARAVFAVAEIAPARTRGSFFTSALATLRLFVDSNIADMTSTSEIEEENVDIEILGRESKIALFCTIPDEKKTRAVLSTLLIDQLYMNLVAIANKNGGRLPTRVNMLIDEFGNLPQINGFDNKLTVSLGRGIRWIIAIQGIGQLYSVYEKDIAKTITSNCHDWIYLLTTDPEQSEMLSKKTGSYTVQTKTVSSSTSLQGTKVNNNINYSSSANVSRRNLLTADEIERLQPPYVLIFKGRELPSVFELPDLSQLKANKYYGMGNPEHNIKLTKEREEKRKIRQISKVDIWLPILSDISNSNGVEDINKMSFEDETDSYID